MNELLAEPRTLSDAAVQAIVVEWMTFVIAVSFGAWLLRVLAAAPGPAEPKP